MDSNEEFLEVGEERDGKIVVYRGDDQPDEWIDWLEPLISELDYLESISDEYKVHLNIAGHIDFLGSLSITEETNFWEGDRTSGIYYYGWIHKRDIRRAQRKGLERLEDAKDDLVKKIKLKRIKALKTIDVLEDIIEATKDYSKELKELDLIKKINAKLVTDNATQLSKLKELEDSNQNEFYQLCLGFLISIATKPNEVAIAGPFVYWKDKIIYAITKIGVTNLPADSAFSKFLEMLKEMSIEITEVEEATPMGYFPLSGNPVYGDEGKKPKDWINIWTSRKRLHLSENQIPRIFKTADQKDLLTAKEIHKFFLDQ